ncbi:MAG: hypothetical protein ACTSQU_08695 [Promethearchaeota archaeon]
MEVSKKEKHDPVVIRIMDYDNLEDVLSKIIIPFSEVLKDLHVPDVYTGYEKIPFEKRYPLYQIIMRQEFADAMGTLICGSF